MILRNAKLKGARNCEEECVIRYELYEVKELGTIFIFTLCILYSIILYDGNER